jgi:hypothetical protein
MPGDVIVTPDKKIAEYVRPTGTRHTWKVKGIPAKVRMKLMSSDEPRAHEPYTLTVDGVVTRGTTNSDENVAITIPPRARYGTLDVGEGDRAEEMTLELGHLNPVSDLAGVQAHLSNMGFRCAASGRLDDETRTALPTYPASVGIAVTGEPDEVTRSRLRTTHDTM